MIGQSPFLPRRGALKRDALLLPLLEIRLFAGALVFYPWLKVSHFVSVSWLGSTLEPSHLLPGFGQGLQSVALNPLEVGVIGSRLPPGRRSEEHDQNASLAAACGGSRFRDPRWDGDGGVGVLQTALQTVSGRSATSGVVENPSPNQSLAVNCVRCCRRLCWHGPSPQSR